MGGTRARHAEEAIRDAEIKQDILDPKRTCGDKGERERERSMRGWKRQSILGPSLQRSPRGETKKIKKKTRATGRGGRGGQKPRSGGRGNWREMNRLTPIKNREPGDGKSSIRKNRKREKPGAFTKTREKRSGLHIKQGRKTTTDFL